MRRLVPYFVAGCLALSGLGLLPASASHDDGSYDIPVWFHWNESTLDILIVPPNHGQVVNGNGVLNGGDPKEATPLNSYLDAIEDSTAEWDDAIAMFAPEWLRSNLVTNVYVVGRDQVPTSALQDPEIIVTTDETKATILGIAVSTRPCIVDNSKFFVTSFTYEDMYNVNMHEVGHCLGLSHILDEHPPHDVMAAVYADTIGAKGTHLHCPSNLDVKGLESVFGPLFGMPGPSTASMPVSQYGTTCSPPPFGPAPDTPSDDETQEPSSSPSPTASSASPTPTATPDDPPDDPPEHEQVLRTVSLRLRRHLVARGEIVADGNAACEADQVARIVRRTRSGWRLVRQVTSTSSGSFRVRLRDKAGVYRARLTASEGCSSATSPRVRHRHR